MRGSEREERRKEGVLVYWVGVKDGCSDAVSGVVVLENTTDGPPRDRHPTDNTSRASNRVPLDPPRKQLRGISDQS